MAPDYSNGYQVIKWPTVLGQPDYTRLVSWDKTSTVSLFVT